MRDRHTGGRWRRAGPTPTPDPDAAIAAYDRGAAGLAARYEAVDPAALFAPVADLLPAALGRVVDVGAGAGRDAAWFARRGHRVVAVEPAAAMRERGRARHAGLPIEWLDDRLPAVAKLRQRRERFDLVLLNGVWHHLDATTRIEAMATLSALPAPGGTLLLRVRHGPTASDRPGFDLPIGETIDAAVRHGLMPIAERRTPAILPANRAAGVTWTWLAFGRG